MAGYVKRIALIKTLKSGYSDDGGELKGLVRCEAYAGHFRVEASLINFAPLYGAVYRAAISDGNTAVIFDAPLYEGNCSFDPTGGFACLIAVCRSGEVKPIASAVCGDNYYLLAALQGALEREEQPPKASYDDEAIAEQNYYELETDETGGAVRADEEAQEGRSAHQNEDVAGAVAVEEKPAESDGGQSEGIKYPTSSFRIGGTPEPEGQNPEETSSPENVQSDLSDDRIASEAFCAAGEEDKGEKPEEKNCPEDLSDGEPARPELAGGTFFERMAGDIKRIFSTYPRATALEDVIEGSRWARISYGNGAHYAFGVIYDGGNARYLCYGVPVESGAPCPKSLEGRAAYVPVDGGGYWVMYQDAVSGISLEAK